MKRYLLGLALLALSFLVVPQHAAFATCGDGASNCFVRTGGGNWNTGTTWATSSGGASCACTPVAGDSVVMDANSGNSTIDAAFSIANLDATGFTGTLTHNAVTLTITGTTFKFVPGMTYSAATNARVVAFTGSGTLALTSAGKTFGALTINGTGTVQLQDSFTAIPGSGIITLTQGTLDTNSQTVSTGSFGSNNSNTRALTLGSSTFTINAATGGNNWDVGAGTNLTLTKGTSNIVVGGTTLAGGFVGGGKSYATVTLQAVTDGTATTISGAPTIDTLSIARNLWITGATTLTLTNAPTWTGTPSAPLGVESTSSVSAATIAVNSPAISYVAMRRIIWSGTTGTATNSFNVGGGTSVTGITITPPGGGGVCIGC